MPWQGANVNASVTRKLHTLIWCRYDSNSRNNQNDGLLQKRLDIIAYEYYDQEYVKERMPKDYQASR